MRILVVEDEMIIRNLIQELLETAGHLVITAVNGQVAVKCLDQIFFDLVVTDSFMPLIGGLELIRIIRQKNQELPIILLSGEGNLRNKLPDQKVVMMKKPFKNEDLLQAITESVKI